MLAERSVMRDLAAYRQVTWRMSFWGNGLVDDVHRQGVPGPVTKRSLAGLVSKILKAPVEDGKPLVEQGLDSLGAAELLEELNLLGFDVAYEYLLGGASIDCLIEALRVKADDGPRPRCADMDLLPLSGPQVPWARLEDEGWGAWGNISLCLSMPASLIHGPYLPAIALSLCDANQAMRMVLVRDGGKGAGIRQKVLPTLQLAVEVMDAPASERDAMRLIEAFEGRENSPFAPSTRALILSSPDAAGRHWLCITMHHVFSDRISMHNLARQAREMIVQKRLRPLEQAAIDFGDVVVWKAGRADGAQGDRHAQSLERMLAGADTTAARQPPRALNPDWDIFAILAARAELRPSEMQALERYAARMGTTLPLLLHAVASVLVAGLTGDDTALSGETDLLVCHVASNRERDPALKGVIGCLDTSVPVAVRLAEGDTLSTLCRKTHSAFAEAHPCVADLPRGSWIAPDGSGAGRAPWTALFERFAHINIVRSPAPGDVGAEITEHAVQRTQATRWGLLLRVNLPARGGVVGADPDAGACVFRAFAEDRVLSGLVPYALIEALRALLAEPESRAPDLPVAQLIASVIARADLAAAQVRRTAAMVGEAPQDQAFIYEKLVARQQRWYRHDARHQLCRDPQNRFVGTTANPFPFTQLNKLAERRFLESHDVPLPRLRHVLPKDGIAQALTDLAPDLPDSFVIKPVGAGHSFGVTLVRDGMDLSRGGVPFDPGSVGDELAAMAARGFCRHEGKVFPFNFSSFLVEDFVQDEQGFPAPTDYKVFMIGEKFLWLQLHFRAGGMNWVAFLDADFRLLPQPAWDPGTCWRTHRTLVCTDQALVDERRPGCLAGILERSRQLAGEMGIFVRLDWYADRVRGPLMGEITTFPHILQPRGFYTPWANALVRSLWQGPDGVAPRLAGSPDGPGGDPIARAFALLDRAVPDTGLAAFLPTEDRALWSVEAGISYGNLRRYIDGFDLSPWGVPPGDRVGLRICNGVQMAAALLATMNRYVAVPFDPALPAAEVAALAEKAGLRALITLANSDEARGLSRHAPEQTIVELTAPGPFALAELPAAGPVGGDASPTNSLDDQVLILGTSGTTGAPKDVSFTLSRLMRSGAAIGASLDLGPDDLGLSMLPLHHVGGITCNLIAPLLASSGMRHRHAFDPRAFFDALTGAQGATWCYLVPAMWGMVLEYARALPDLGTTRPWPRLRAIRSAGAALPDAMARDLARLFGDGVAILPTYGMTEAMPIAAPPLSYRLERPGSVGHVLSPVAVEIIDHTSENLPRVADGVVGEITVSGPCVFGGYDGDAGDPDVFTPRGYFRTGDLGSLSADGSGWLMIEGRIREMINLGGETIPPARIEDVVRLYPGWGSTDVIEVSAFARVHDTLGEDVALAVAGAGPGVTVSDLADWAVGHLPAAMVPKTLVHVPDLPRSGTGKIRRAQIAAAFNAQTPAGRLGCLQTFVWDGDDTAPRLLSASDTHDGPAHKDKASAVSLDAVLQVIRRHTGSDTQIGPDTSLFDAGVNSLAAVELSLLLGRRFQIDLPAWIISDHPTPRALCAAIAGLAGPGAAPLGPAEASSPATPRTTPLRILFLHGEGADADLMEISLRATHWVGRLAGRLDFVFLDAPHLCAPMPEFHEAAVAAGLYGKAEYRSWAVTRADTLQASLAAVRAKLDQFGPFDAIGGICDGALVAALTAMQRPELAVFLAMSPGPVSRLAPSWQAARRPVTCRAMHLISDQDADHSLAQQLEIAGLCQNAQIVQHDRGHAVPHLSPDLERDVLRLLGQAAPEIAPPVAPVPVRPVADGARYERLVAKYTARVLGRRRMERDLDFYDAGGDSLKAIILALKLEQKIGMDLPFEVLFADGATVESMARAIAQHQHDSETRAMSPIAPSAAAREVFALPPLHGRHSVYMAIARALSDKARLLGVKPPVLGRGVWKHSASLPDIAQEAAAAIIAHTDRRTIDLMGCSAGGVLALETARALTQRGYRIGCLALIDSDFTSDGSRWPVVVKYLAEWQKHASRRIRGKTNLRRGYRQLHFRAQLADWRPEPVSAARAVFFQAQDGIVDDRQIAQWRAATDGDLDVVRFPGTHEAFVLPEVAQTIAQAIAARMEPPDSPV